MRRTPRGDSPAVRIDPETGWAWRGDERLDLAPKAFAVLCHLIQRPEHLVTKDELLAAAWGDTVVGEATLTSCIRDLRKALDDSSRAPRYIETVHRRGFRFIGPVGAPRASPPPRPASSPPASMLVGRDADLARLDALLATAVGGQRRVVFVTGEAGIGKTTLVEAFIARMNNAEDIHVGRGQCVEQYGASEPYLPLLEALGRMGREPRGDALRRVLRQYAPTWLVQLPALLADEEIEAVQRRAQGTTRERMLRELIEALDAFGTDAPLVLVLEDLHWSDAATIDLVAMIARRRDPAPLLVVATYRPADVAALAHPLKPVQQELRVHGHCEELALDFLGEAAVGEYLARRFPGASFSPDVARVLHENTSGNPLFLVNVVDDLVAQGHVREDDGRWTLSIPLERVAAGVPHTLSQMIEKQIDRLAPREQAVLAVASVAGADFSAALSAADGIDPRDGERSCEALARRGQFLRAAGPAEWPDGTVAGRYAFIHAMYRSVLYERIPIGHRVGLHLRIGARLERAHGARAGEIAGELAMHFEHGRDFARAVHYRRHAAEMALRQHGYREAVDHAKHGLGMLAALPESPERNRQEIEIQTVLGAATLARAISAPRRASRRSSSPSCSDSAGSISCAARCASRGKPRSTCSASQRRSIMRSRCSERTTAPGCARSTAASSSPRSATSTARARSTIPSSTARAASATSRSTTTRASRARRTPA
jgi:DNA-binding winged helix-turn-helix (wHTH) protein